MISQYCTGGTLLPIGHRSCTMPPRNEHQSQTLRGTRSRRVGSTRCHNDSRRHGRSNLHLRCGGNAGHTKTPLSSGGTNTSGSRGCMSHRSLRSHWHTRGKIDRRYRTTTLRCRAQICRYMVPYHRLRPCAALLELHPQQQPRRYLHQQSHRQPHRQPHRRNCQIPVALSHLLSQKLSVIALFGRDSDMGQSPGPTRCSRGVRWYHRG